jgi:serine phosphatase RsbU (regulator of sigma subunit)
MDMALCIIDHHAMNIKYAGANQPVYLVRDQILTKYKPDKMPIGISFDTLNPFKEKTIEIKPNDMIYLTTDGILDQFGGLDNKKFLSSRFDKMLERISFKSLLEQKEAIVFEFEDWKANFEQVDDILVMGVKI